MLGLRKWQSKRSGQNPIHKVSTKTPKGVFYCYIRRVNKQIQFMPRKSSTTATPTKTRKTRTRKTSTTRSAKALATPKKVTATVRKVKSVAKVTTPKPVTRPSTARLITPQRYLADIQTRWQIHNFEIQELISDFVKGFEAVKPYHAQLVKMVNK